jgi:pyridinium-3,5-bisthiocarboxylic acid mononucleotide nickel chelatase
VSRALAVDARYGAAGDMFLGALVDLGADLTVAQRALDTVYPGLLNLESAVVDRCGEESTKVTVVELQSSQQSRLWADIEETILSSALNGRVKEFSYKVFDLLAQAEADAHQVPISEVHFHEIGAVDSIADIIGTAALLDSLDISQLWCTHLEVGSGEVESNHGTLEIPAPATARIIEGSSYSATLKGEALTPTGAAIILALGEVKSNITLSTRQGRGAGSRNPKEYPNVLRVSILDDVNQDIQSQIESNIDDIDPRLIPVVIEKLMAAGALDAWVEPIMMKKDRPGFTLKVLCLKSDEKKLGEIIFRESSSIGYRTLAVEKVALERHFVTINLRNSKVSVKVAISEGKILQVSPEFDEVLALANELGVPVRVLMDEARSIARNNGLIYGENFSE